MAQFLYKRICQKHLQALLKPSLVSMPKLNSKICCQGAVATALMAALNLPSKLSKSCSKAFADSTLFLWLNWLHNSSSRLSQGCSKRLLLQPSQCSVTAPLWLSQKCCYLPVTVLRQPYSCSFCTSLLHLLLYTCTCCSKASSPVQDLLHPFLKAAHKPVAVPALKGLPRTAVQPLYLLPILLQLLLLLRLGCYSFTGPAAPSQQLCCHLLEPP
jgi:hypothetical protein